MMGDGGGGGVESSLMFHRRDTYLELHLLACLVPHCVVVRVMRGFLDKDREGKIKIEIAIEVDPAAGCCMCVRRGRPLLFQTPVSPTTRRRPSVQHSTISRTPEHDVVAAALLLALLLALDPRLGVLDRHGCWAAVVAVCGRSGLIDCAGSGEWAVNCLKWWLENGQQKMQAGKPASSKAQHTCNWPKNIACCREQSMLLVH